MNFNKLTVVTSVFLSVLLIGQSTTADGDFPRDEYLMGINWVQAPKEVNRQVARVNFTEPSNMENEAKKNDGLVSSRDEYLMGINYKDEALSADVSVTRANFSMEHVDAAVDSGAIFPDPDH